MKGVCVANDRAVFYLFAPNVRAVTLKIPLPEVKIAVLSWLQKRAPRGYFRSNAKIAWQGLLKDAAMAFIASLMIWLVVIVALANQDGLSIFRYATF